jgi:ATP-dependent Clp protease ATP-binding subunit ClpB
MRPTTCHTSQAAGHVGDGPVSVAEEAQASRTLAALTQGMPLSAIRSNVLLAMDHRVPAADVQNAVRLFRSGLAASPWDQPETRATISNAADLLNDKVIDQPSAVRAVADILARAAIGLSGAQSAGHPSLWVPDTRSHHATVRM